MLAALQIWDLDDPTEPRTPSVRPLSSVQVRRLLEDPLGSPLSNDPAAGRSTLGGVQPKLVLVRGADTLRRVAPESDLSHLARMAVLAVAIGNLDMHTKNLGILHPEDGSITLAASGTFNADSAGAVKVKATFAESGEFPVQVYKGTSATGTPVVNSVLVVTAPPTPAPTQTDKPTPTAEPTDAVTIAANDGGADATPWIWAGVGVVAVAAIGTGVGLAVKRRRDAA